jgi:type I restriction enzyme, S subunit
MNNSQEYTKIEESWINNKEFPIKRMKYLVNFIRGIEPGSKNYGIEGEGKRFIRVNDIGSNNKNNVYVKVETDAVCNNGDILLCLDGSPGITTREMKGIFSTGLRKLELKEDTLNYDYLFYSLNCDFVQEAIQFFSKGTTIMHASDVTNYLKQPLPDLATQKIIVNFLDEKTEKIDALINNKKNQIRILNEKEKLTIEILFKKGVNNKQLIDSGIEWIGKIPSNWKIKKLKKLLLPKNGIKIGPFGSQLKIEIMKPSGYKVYGQENVIYNDFNRGINYIDKEKFEELKQCEIVTGDIVIAMMGTIGNTHLVPEGIEKGIMNSHLLRLRTNKELIAAEFLSLGLNKAHYLIQNIIRNSKGAIMQGLNSEIIKNLLIALPPINEQEKIVKYLNEKTSKIQRAIKLIKKEILRLEEYKKILINNAVTGRIKVGA